MKQVADITLVENSTAGNPPKAFPAQTVEIRHEVDATETSVDGHIGVGRHPSKIFWRGGAAKDLENITDVKIASNDGEVLIDGEATECRATLLVV